MPLDMLITGRIATLSGDSGFGWVEAIGIRDGRIAFAGSEVSRPAPIHSPSGSVSSRIRSPSPGSPMPIST